MVVPSDITRRHNFTNPPNLLALPIFLRPPDFCQHVLTANAQANILFPTFGMWIVGDKNKHCDA